MKPRIFQYNRKIRLELGESLPSLNLAYHTYGNLNEEGNNVIWVCHALTANSEVDEWWPGMIGENKVFDPEKFFIISVNIPGSCYGSTGPLSSNPETGLPWFRSFPKISIRDIVGTFELLRKALGIKRIHTIIGGSIGGFQALEYSISHPELIDNLVILASSASISPWAVAFNQSQRLAIESDPGFKEDKHYGGLEGLVAARSIALLSYRTSAIYNESQQETDNNTTANFRAASYQEYQGTKLARRFDAYSYHTITQIMDSHNVARGRGSLHKALSLIKAKVLAIGFSSDILFPIAEQRLLSHITNGDYAEITSDFGHDGFLIETDRISEEISKFWKKYNSEIPQSSNPELNVEWSQSA